MPSVDQMVIYIISIIFILPWADACKSKSCPTGAQCSNVPGTGAVCRCTKPLQTVKNNKCGNFEDKVKIKIIAVTGTRFNQVFIAKYNDRSSKEYKDKAAAFQQVLIVSVCSKIVGCITIQINNIAKGSIVVDYSVITDANKQVVTAAQVQSASVQALKDPAMAVFKPDTTTTPKAQGKQRLYFTS